MPLHPVPGVRVRAGSEVAVAVATALSPHVIMRGLDPFSRKRFFEFSAQYFKIHHPIAAISTIKG